MTNPDWHILGEIEAGDVWAALAQHSPVEAVDRVHCATQTRLGFWMSPHRNVSRGRFLSSEHGGAHAPLGRVVAVPAGFPIHVRAEAVPTRMMLHCRLPGRVAPTRLPEGQALETCLDLRNDAVSTCLSRLALEVAEPGFGSNAIIEGLGLLIAGELARTWAGAADAVKKGGLAPWQLRRIDEHLLAGNWDTSISDLARLCGISPGHAMRGFRQSTGCSIAEHVSASRMERARVLLAGDRHSIAEIAADLRFAQASSFTAAFRRATGMTPNGYRQRQRAR